ncbi:hypothetical protein PEL8287_03893 [Roseovarius litorisediminis]|uniref:DUF2852 domain-containing protein n=1 Tax=Roseovarius litorisediminis TaxID=1312363 RepID=A0A1Y5TR44_9RHOB|nr:DUF2852 domain-containing protein [Roseovarius litorisediminis]SLN69942.1 hypothetical protein PEL8287_03893 [Roseovarius litorisediminis]
MSTLAQSTPATGLMGWLSRAEAWLDDKGKGAWIVAMVLAFIFVWPLGLGLLAYMIWSNKMFTKPNGMTCSHRRRHMHMSRPTGNAAFDAYKSETLRRLEEEQENFESFLQRLRDARDKAEFDQFMDDRAKTAGSKAPKEA